MPSFESYHRAALRKRATGTKPTPRSARAITRPLPQKPRWPYRFTQQQIYRARRAGCPFDAADLVRAREMHRRGFTLAEFLQAYEDVKRVARGDRTQLLAVAAFRAAGFDIKQYTRYRRSKRSLTGYYNQHIARAPGLRIAGWVLLAVGVGMTSIVTGFKVSGDAELRRCEENQPFDDYHECGAPGLIGLGNLINGVLIGLGVATTVTGGVMAAVSYHNKLERLKTPLLDNADAETLRDFRRWRHLVRTKAAGTGARVYLSPTVRRGGAGLLLKVQF